MICYNRRRRRGRQSAHRGQAMLEYVLVTVAMIAVFLTMGYLVNAARRNAARAESLVKSDMP